MGHVQGGKSSLVPLIDRLNRYPVGLVDNDKLRQILALLFDEDEAFIASRFPLEEATLSELVRETGLPADILRPKLERMADKGLVMDMPYGDEVYWLLLPGLIGFFEFTFMKKRVDLPMAEVARLMRGYLHDDPGGGQAAEFFGSPTQLTRSLVYDEHIPVSSTITSYEDARQIIKQADFGAVGMCFCRHQKAHLGDPCRKGAPVEGICISLGEGARFLVRRGFAQQKSTAELLAVLEEARRLRLTHVTDNIRHKPSFICNCCSCCCELMAGVQAGYHDGIAKTPFTAVIDADRCTLCGQCFAACNVKGICAARSPQRHAVIDQSACLGCGACVGTCAQGAIRLVERTRRPLPPRTKTWMFVRILVEKGRLWPFILQGAKRRLRRLWSRS